MKEFKVNEYITLRLENQKTIIYIKEVLFQQCKFLLINIPVEEISIFNKIESIDEAAELLDQSLHEMDSYHYNISPDVEFWAHCSNLQVWAENEYDTRILHRNLAFSLLKKLSESGDPLAKKRYKEEIAERFVHGSIKIQYFLEEEGYLEDLSREELLSLIKDSDIITKLGMLFGKPLIINSSSYGFTVEDGIIKWLRLDNCGVVKVPEIVRELKSLKGLNLSRNSLELLPEWIGEFEHLEVLDVSNNQLKEIPESIGDLKDLKQLKLQDNKLKELPNSIGNLAQLEVFFASNNLLEDLPESIGELISLQDLVFGDNLIKTIPESIGKMRLLKKLDIGENPIQKLPHSILYLKNLRSIFIEGLDEEDSLGIINNLRRKKVNIYR